MTVEREREIKWELNLVIFLEVRAVVFFVLT